MNIFILSGLELIILGFSLLLHRRVFGRWRHPVPLISVWWLSWLFVAVSGISGLYPISVPTQSMILLMIASFNLGSLAGGFRDGIDISFRFKWKVKMKNIDRLFTGLIFALTLFFFLRGLWLMRDLGGANYRSLTFTQPGRPSILFIYPAVELLYYLLVFSGILFYFYRLLAFIRSGGREKRIAFGAIIICLLMEGIMRLGRYNFYYLFMGVLFSFVLHPGFSMKKINRKLISGVFAAIVVLFSLVFFTGKSRTIHGAGGFLEQVAYYHTVSFALFDRELKENRTGMEDRTWGRMNVGGLDIITGLFARKLGFPDYGKDMEKTGRLLQDQLEVGPGKYANAFYGIMYAFYRDGGWTGFVIFPLIWGFLLSRAFHLLRKTGKEYFFSIVLLGMHIAIFSLFQNQLDSFSVWICLLALAVRHNFIEEVE